MGYRESLLAALLSRRISEFNEAHNRGSVSGADGYIRLHGRDVRAPGFAFVSWINLPGGAVPTEAYPSIVPDFVIEVISPGDTYAEMSRKRRELFQSGTRLI